MLVTKEMGVPVPLTVRLTGAVPPTVTEKVAAVVVSAKDWLVAVTVRLTVAAIAVLPLVPVIVIAEAPEGSAMLATVVIVNVACWEPLPLSVTLPGLKLQSAPAGRPAVQLPGLEAVELVKLTVPVKPLLGVMVTVEIEVCPAGTLAGLSALADMVNGTVTVTVVGAEVEAPTDASPV